MLIQLETKESCTTIALHGQFVFDTHRDFRDASTRALQEASQEIQIDLSKLGYMDSSALGMLLLLRDHAGGDDAEVQVINISSDVRKILAISNFDKLFDIN